MNIGFSKLNICIAEVKENAESRNATSESGLSQNVGQTSFALKLAQICEIHGDIYSFSFSAVGLLSAKA